MKIIWSDEATAELWEILMMVAEYAGLASSERYQSEFERLVALAADNPRMGSIGIIPKTRELYPINGQIPHCLRDNGRCSACPYG
uniref:type II toxin-antitoxin system RelE/ParE family toxin n=1 Tax=Neisseria lactamica TaxID=486 RepID=UPI00159ED6A0|nr:type II toxin-antitoxin system RelE/ParE family toxin [Neisseria lactamica]